MRQPRRDHSSRLVSTFLPWSSAGPAGRRVRSAGARSLRAALRAVLAPPPSRRPGGPWAPDWPRDQAPGRPGSGRGVLLAEDGSSRPAHRSRPFGRCAVAARALTTTPSDQRHRRLREGRRGVATARGVALRPTRGGDDEHQQNAVPGPAVLAALVRLRLAVPGGADAGGVRRLGWRGRQRRRKAGGRPCPWCGDSVSRRVRRRAGQWRRPTELNVVLLPTAATR
jgi:hypothetical protein